MCLLFSALVKNLYDTVNNQALGIHYQDLLMKCIWKVIKFLGNWQEHLDYVAIFTDIHSFLRVCITSHPTPTTRYCLSQS